MQIFGSSNVRHRLAPRPQPSERQRKAERAARRFAMDRETETRAREAAQEAAKLCGENDRKARAGIGRGGKIGGFLGAVKRILTRKII